METIPARLLFKGARIVTRRSCGGVSGWRWSGKVLAAKRCKTSGRILVDLSTREGVREVLQLDPHERVGWANPRKDLAAKALDRVFYVVRCPGIPSFIASGVELRGLRWDSAVVREVILVEVSDHRRIPEAEKVSELAYCVDAIRVGETGWEIRSTSGEPGCLYDPWSGAQVDGVLRLFPPHRIGVLA